MTRRIKGHIPIRTCISCGARRNKGELTRLILDVHGMVVQDVTGKGQVRGAYVCRSRPCLEKLGRDNRLSRVFRKEGPITVCPELRAAM